MPIIERTDDTKFPAIENSTVQSRSWWVAVPAVGMALLPNVTCPACWPVYVALLSSVGVSVVVTTKYLHPLTVFFVVLALVSLGWGARRRRGFGPLIVGCVGASLLITGRFVVASNALFYFGLATFISANLWNGWSRKKSISSETGPTDAACPNCKPLVSLQKNMDNQSSDNARHGSVT